jgi:hypothetical protein
MEWLLRDGPVYFAIIVVVFFFTYVAIRSNKNDKDKK